MWPFLTQLFWRALALASVVAGGVGILVPVLPTVPFLLLAAWAAGKGWPAMEAWMLNHPRFGHPIRQWRQHGAVPRRAKWAAVLMMGVSGGALLLTGLPAVAKLVVLAVMVAVGVWLWRRPEV